MTDEQKKKLAELKAQPDTKEVYPLCVGELENGVPTAKAQVVFCREPTFPECQFFLDQAVDTKAKGKAAVTLFGHCLLHPATIAEIKRAGHVVALANKFIEVAGINDDVAVGK
jgi:hypothetical protein